MSGRVEEIGFYAVCSYLKVYEIMEMSVPSNLLKNIYKVAALHYT
jgi:hypothetical protein